MSLRNSKQERMLDTCQLTKMFIVHMKVSVEGGTLLEARFSLKDIKGRIFL